MNCLHPVRLFDTGLKTDKGKPVYFFDRTGADRISPQQCQKRGYPVSYWLDKYIEVPCGSCVACRENRSKAWAFRMAAELVTTNEKNLRSYFLTMTYDDLHLPKDAKLSKSDLVNFHKRLRAAVGPFRFYAVANTATYTDALTITVFISALTFRTLSITKAKGLTAFILPKRFLGVGVSVWSSQDPLRWKARLTFPGMSIKRPVTGIVSKL